MSQPILYPEALDHLDRYQRLALAKLLRGYERLGYRCISMYRFNQLHRVIIRDAKGNYVRSFFAVQAKAVHTLWHSSKKQKAIDDQG